MKATVTVQLLMDAARIINREAAALKQSCHGNNKAWACGDCTGNCAAKEDHRKMTTVHARLVRAVKEAAHREAQLEAFKHSGLRRHGISFAAALQTPPIAICLRVAAEIRARKLQERRA